MHLYATRIRHALIDLARRLQCNPDDEVMDVIIYRLQQILRHLVCMGNRFDEVQGAIAATILILEDAYVQNRRAVNVIEHTSNAAERPKFVITKEQLEYMLAYDISVSDIAQAFSQYIFHFCDTNLYDLQVKSS